MKRGAGDFDSIDRINRIDRRTTGLLETRIYN
jgi:hypothetical protein